MAVKPVQHGGSESEAVHAAPPGAHAEVELKLLAEPGAMERLRQAPIIAQHACNGGLVRRLDAIYYDTPDRALYRNGMSLRVRRSGSRYIQTLKRVAANGSNFARQEWETPVESVAPDLARLPSADIGDSIDVSANGLVPIFSTKVRRRTQRLELADTVVEVAFDEGTIEARGRSEPLAEIELELKAGRADILYGIGTELLEIAPLRIGTASKSDRGYGLAFDDAPDATKAGPSLITAEHTVDDAIAVLLGSNQQHLLANQAIAEDGRNPEGVHQMRVALRRLRTAFSVFRREMPLPSMTAFNNEARQLGQKLGAARNWDVFLENMLTGPAKACAAYVSFEMLRAAVEPLREASYAALRETLQDPAYNRFQLSLGHWIGRRGWRNEVPSEVLGILSEPISAMACRALTKLENKALKQGQHFRRLPPQARHKLRITLKKLRYAAEFFLPLYADRPEAKRYLSRLAKLQDALGYDHDAASLPELLDAIGQEASAPELHRSIGALIGWQARDAQAAAEALRKRWRQFKETPPHWNG